MIKRLCNLFKIYTCVVRDEDSKLTSPYDNKTACEMLMVNFRTNKGFANKNTLAYPWDKDREAFETKLFSLERVKTFKIDRNCNFEDVTCLKEFLTFHFFLRDKIMKLSMSCMRIMTKNCQKKRRPKKQWHYKRQTRKTLFYLTFHCS